MDIRKRLLIAFSAVTVAVLALFGAVSYTIALDAGATKQAELLRHIAQDQAAKIALTAGTPPHLDRIGQALWMSKDAHYAVTVLNNQGAVIAGTPFEKLFGTLGHSLPLHEMLADQSHYGYDTQGHDSLLWATAPIPGTPYTLLIVNYQGDTVKSLMSTLGWRLLLTATIIILIAIGGALFLSASIARRLDQKNAAMLHQAMHDTITGLANRNQLHKWINEYLKGRNEAHLALLVMDLDRFKEVNDTLGHHVGDELLEQVARRIEQAAPSAELIARLGGDEFAVLLIGRNEDQAIAVARDILQALSDVFSLNDIDVDVAGSLGIALLPEHGNDANTLTQRAEIAMYRAKQRKTSPIIYRAEFDPYSTRRLRLMGELRNAVDQRQLLLYYQPKVDLHNECTVSVEALLRWNHPEHGFVPPMEFIPPAEQSDLIQHLTFWVLDEALLQCRAWRQLGYHLGMAVNISARSLHDLSLPIKVGGLLAKWAVPAEQLTLEITETAIMTNPEHALKVLNRLHAMGVHISIDDFGTGYSSLMYLKKLPVSQIKIDRSFVMEMQSDENDAVIVRSTIDLGHNMGCQVVAEGVENKEIMSALKSLGCDTAQGYHINRPLPAHELSAWLSNCAWPVAAAPPTDPTSLRNHLRTRHG